MKLFYRDLALIAVMAATIPSSFAAEWSYDWPKSATADKPDYAGGFYNFGSSYDSELTSMSRTLDGRVWNLTFDKGTKLAYIASSGQSIGSSGAFTSQFALSSNAFSGKIKRISVAARTKAADAMLSITVNGVNYNCEGAENVCYTNTATTPLEYTFLPAAGSEQEGEIVMSFTIPGADKNAYIKKVVVEFEDVVSSVATPVFAPEAGTFDAPVTIEITADADAVILYTTDGSSPRAEGNQAVITYSAPFEIAETAVVKAVAVKGSDYSAVAEARYVIRKSPGLSIYGKTEFEIELLEEDVIIVDNPNKVEPIVYKSANPQVAWADEFGHIYTYSVGETTIFAGFAGNEEYLPQEISVPVRVIAKTPLSGLSVTPGEGTYNGLTEVVVQCTDPKAKALWYHIGDKPMTVDELGILDTYEINKSTTMTLELDHSCVLSVQAMGENVWSEPQFINYTINMPLQAAFEASDQYEVIYRNGFDCQSDLDSWNQSTGANWQLHPGGGGYSDLPAFSSINPDSKSSLFHSYGFNEDIAIITSPVLNIPDNGEVQFYAAFNPVWIYDGNLVLYVIENVDGAAPVEIWNAFMESQQAATDDIKWNRYNVDLENYAGKEVYFAFAYSLTNGDNILIDDFELIQPKHNLQSVTIDVDDSLEFVDLSTGEPESWEWQFPGTIEQTSTVQNPVVNYNQPGVYDVTLTVRKGDEVSTVTREKYVVVRSVAPTAEIGVPDRVYYSPEAGLIVPLNTSLTFRDESEGCPTSYSWTLPGTDVQTSDMKDVTVQYVAEGMYDIDLKVSNEAGTSSAYLHGVKAGGESLAWNIAPQENTMLDMIALGWYGYYGGSNWLDMVSFAEEFEAPIVPVTISSVNVYFASVKAVTTDAEIVVSLTKSDAEGKPGDVLATASMPVTQLIDASETYNDPTTFVFETPIEVSDEFFITISGFPNGNVDGVDDCVVMYSVHREPGESSTTYHLLKEYDAAGTPTGEFKWYAQEEECCSFAIAPKLMFANKTSAVESVVDEQPDAPVTYYNLQGIRVNPKNLAPGIYIRRQGNIATKVKI